MRVTDSCWIAISGFSETEGLAKHWQVEQDHRNQLVAIAVNML